MLIRICLLMPLTYFAINEMEQLNEDWKQYFSEFWNYLDSLPLLLLIVSLVLSIMEIVHNVTFQDPIALAQYLDSMPQEKAMVVSMVQW